MIEIRKYKSNCTFLEDVSFFLFQQLINAFFPSSLYCLQICLDTRRIWLDTYPCYSKVKPCSSVCSMEPERLVNDLPFILYILNRTFSHVFGKMNRLSKCSALLFLHSTHNMGLLKFGIFFIAASDHLVTW